MMFLGTDSAPFGAMLQFMRSLPEAAREAWRGKQAAWHASARLRHPARDLDWNEDTAAALRSEIRRLLPGKPGTDHAAARLARNAPLCEEDCIILEDVSRQTRENNRSNITRTAAYLACYEECPELHWALLAHMVSRNGGYHMTDLQSGLMRNLQDETSRQQTYRLLERSNALIFQDAYPQLLLYQHSRRLGRSCFHLLSHFHVSAFMTPFWERFWLEKCSSLLSTALIINEQNYIEGRVVQHPYFHKNIISSPSFRLHDLAGLNQIVFPLGKGLGIVGRVLERFDKLDERIAFGKCLYAMLFGMDQVLDGVLKFARAVPHQGSRAEYWPGLFTAVQHESENNTSQRCSAELVDEEWLPEGQRLYSPKLLDVWHETPYEPLPRYDWLQNADCLSHISTPKRPWIFEISHEHRFGILKTALAHDAQTILH